MKNFKRCHFPRPTIISSVLSLWFWWTAGILYADPKPVVLDSTYTHDRFVTQPGDIIREFQAFTSSFDSEDDDNHDGTPDRLGIPQWVAYQIKEYKGKIPSRPRPEWFTDEGLYRQGLAPDDKTYAYSKKFRDANPNWYVRGHLAMKQHAERLGADAGWNTHTMLNAVPQRDEFNSGIWLDLEIKTAEWADLYGSVWIITGPVFYDGKPRSWLGEIGEIPAAIPDALFKVVVKDSRERERPDVLGFIYPQEGPGYKKGSQYQHTLYMATVDSVERLTGLNFLTALPDSIEETIESIRSQDLWGMDGRLMGNEQEGSEDRININRASKAQLEGLPGIGSALAQRIIEGRPYSRVDDLLRVKGIGKATLERLRALVGVQ